MPLNQPYAYVVTYDLKSPAFLYRDFFAELQRSDRWFHYLTSSWIVLRKDSLVEMENRLVPLIKQGDRLLIMPAKGPAGGWLQPDAWNWINANVPREW